MNPTWAEKGKKNKGKGGPTPFTFRGEGRGVVGGAFPLVEKPCQLLANGIQGHVGWLTGA